jgi:hypothetical protein
VCLQYEYIEKICIRNLSRLSVGAGNILGLSEEQGIFLMVFVSVQGHREKISRSVEETENILIMQGSIKKYFYGGRKHF